jgi:hypothetical protein
MNKPKLKLIGLDGNAFMILGAALKAARKAGWTAEMIGEFQTQAMSGDYKHLLSTVADWFEVE